MRGDGGQVARVEEWGWGKKGLGWRVGLIEKKMEWKCGGRVFVCYFMNYGLLAFISTIYCDLFIMIL